MATLMIVFLVALTLTAMGTPAVRHLALTLGFLDLPSDRKLHPRPLPLLGGVAMTAGVTVAFSIFLVEFHLTPRVIGVLLSVPIMFLLGLVDDRWNLPVWVKLVAQAMVVVLLVSMGVRVQLPVPELVNYALTAAWIIGISNAVNFLDNMDGLCAGVCAVASAFIVLAAAAADQVLVASLGAALLGACLGFLRYNFHPAQILMGDAGSLFLGFILAVLGILLRFPDNVNFVTWMVPVFILGLPIFDTSLVVISRLRRGVNPLSTAGKDHTSHRLVQLGFTQRETVLILYLVAGMLGVLAMFITQSDPLEGYIIAATVALLALVAIYRLESLPSNGAGSR